MCNCMQDDPGWLMALLVAFSVLLLWRLFRRQESESSGRSSGHVLILIGTLALTTVLPGWFSGCAAPAKVENSPRPETQPPSDAAKAGDKPTEPAKPVQAQQGEGAKVALRLPKLLDLGATQCIPCKKMAPILEELKVTYKEKLDVQFIDVWINPNASQLYGIESIPTQIFYSADGKELFRHEGFFSKQDILAKWKELGVDLGVAEPQK